MMQRLCDICGEPVIDPMLAHIEFKDKRWNIIALTDDRKDICRTCSAAISAVVADLASTSGNNKR